MLNFPTFLYTRLHFYERMCDILLKLSIRQFREKGQINIERTPMQMYHM